MAQVIRVATLDQLVAKDLENLLGFWHGVPELAEEWPEWDDLSRSDVVIQYPILRGARSRVMKAAKAGLLDEGQRRKYEELLRLIEEHRATVEWMLDGPI